MRIASKEEFLALSRQGRCGNVLRSWDRTRDIPPEVHWLGIRSRENASPCFVAEVARKHLEREIRRLATDRERLYFQEIPAPGSERVANLEAMPCEGGLYIHLETQATLPVRGIRERTRPWQGAAGRVMLRAAVGEESYETLCELWDKYPDHIIEATQFSRACGMYEDHLVVWEIRIY